ncbi:MAG: hydrolase [Candidatus Eisenbacteria sp.]|nr:hydrolase [Candidatus Eisenbacteria bacterium]
MLKQDQAVLVVVDYQGKLLPSIAGQEGLLRRAGRLIRGARLLELSIVVTEQYPKGVGPTEAGIVTALGDAYRPIQKKTMSCMGVSEFREALEATGKRQVLLCGIEAHVCVHQSAADLLEAGYEVHLIADCVSSREARDAEHAVQRAAQMGCRISTHEMAIFEILRRSDTPAFKEWIKIIR